jgi:nitrogen fixation/metabolism regulation signal transduction histidine kinase
MGAALGDAVSALTADQGNYARLVAGPDAGAFYRRIDVPSSEFSGGAAQFRTIMAAGKSAEAKALYFARSYPAGPAVEDAISAAARFSAAGASRLSDNATAYDHSGRLTVIGFMAAVALAALLAGVFLMAAIAKPIAAMTAVMHKLASGDLEVSVPGRERGDDFGRMGAAVDVFKRSMSERDRLEREQETLKAQATMAQKAALHRVADAFEARIVDSLRLLYQRS